MNHQMTPVDWIALACFAAGWWGYPWYAAWHAKSRPSLNALMNAYRRQWMRQVLAREGRIVDSSILANLANSATFFSSTTILILGGLLALIDNAAPMLSALGKLPYAQRMTAEMWELKIILMLLIFTYAFFKFTWSLRQFNFVSILVGATPAKESETGQQDQLAERAGRILEHAGDSFSEGLRAYYFAIAALTWFVHPALLALGTIWVVAILYYLEFRSDTVRALM